MIAMQVSQEHKLEEMQASQDRKTDDIKGQIKGQLVCVISEMKSEMENRLEFFGSKRDPYCLRSYGKNKWSGRNCP